MTPLTEMLIVAVPGGSTRDGAILRGVIVPRLSGLDESATVADYGMADWPDLLRRSTVTISAAASPPDPAQPIAGVLRQDADSQVWQAMFQGAKVRPWTAPAAYPDPHVVPSAGHLTTVEKVYANVGRSAGDPAVIDAQLQTVTASTLPPPPDTTDETARRAEKPDFHKLATFFREHPAVLRVLGLIIEIDIADPAVLAALGSGVVALGLTLPGDAAAAFAPTFPWTRFDYADDRFLPAAAAGSDTSRGMLDLGGQQWKVATFDVAATMERLRLAKAATGQGSAATLPAIRSTGLSLLRGGRERQMRARNRIATANAARRDTPLVLWADDLVLGYRVDVRTTASNWSSLCRRTAAYTTGDGTLPIGPPHEEEGHVKAQGATFRGAGRSDDPTRNMLLADETVVRWDGWSMACPHPQQGSGLLPVRPGAANRWLSWQFAPVGVPELRFGKTYLVRMRIADIAGGGLGIDDPDQFEGACNEKFYGRHDPVPPPEIPAPPGLIAVSAQGETHVVPSVLGPGGLLDVLVIRSDPGAPDGGLNVDQYAAGHPYPANRQRMLLPPPAPFILCDQSGAFDRDDPDDELDDETFATLLGRATMPPAYTADGEYSWLPDWEAEGITLAPLPGPTLGTPPVTEPPPEAWTVPDGQWPDYTAKHLHLRARKPGEKAIDWPDGRTAVVRLAPAETVTVEISSSVTGIGQFAMTNWLQTGIGTLLPGADDPEFLDRLMDLVRGGRHPLVSPPRQVRFVHAVQHPNFAPAGTLVAARLTGQTFATLRDAQPDANPWFGLHPPSTAQLDIAATWPEWDTLGKEEPEVRSQQVGSFSLDLAATGLPELRHEFGDTRHRIVTYTLTAVSRFQAFFDPLPAEAFQQNTIFTVKVPNCATPAPPAVLAVTPAFSWQTTARNGRYSKTRRGGLLRLELATPWHLSGQDEQIGIAVYPEASAPPTEMTPFVSRIRRDPIWATDLPSPLRPEMFPRATDALAVTPAGSPAALTILAHNVRYHAPSERWFADVEIDQPAESYWPFVDLAVVRLQQSSLPGCEASTVVRADSVQLPPDRTLTCWTDATGIRVRLDGVGPIGARPNIVHATVERLPADLDSDLVEVTALSEHADGIPAWRRIASEQGALGVDLPALAQVDQPGHCRLVVQEIERYAETGSGPNSELNKRTVFLDVIRLSDLTT